MQRYHRADQEKLKKKQSPPALIRIELPRKQSNVSPVVRLTPPIKGGRDKSSSSRSHRKAILPAISPKAAA
ncbi:unnamed protein product [Arabis nemorensis]|uniref:Uncharacterized protein n=1 Tax=Arabis nemorensis TaxID=586526 RepID=A0A565BK62_9BRAS|nr:unnamed protein product [Arabis nemorensis]